MSRNDISISGPAAERAVREHNERRLVEAREALERTLGELEDKAEAARALGLDPERILPDRQSLEAAMMPRFEADQRVLLYTSGTGRVWPDGAHLRSGTIIKSGQTAWSYMVALDQPIGDSSVVNVLAVDLTPYDDELVAVLPQSAVDTAVDTAADTAAAAAAAGTTPAATVLDHDE